MLDCGAGLGGASAAMRARGWLVKTLDIDPKFGTDIVADLRTYHYTGPRLDLLWVSAPCDEFAREFMPWSRTGKAPDPSIVQGGRRLIAECQPRYYVIENVVGAQWWIGKSDQHVGPFHLWTNLPPIGKPKLNTRNKESMSSSAAEERAKIPYALSLAVALTVETAIEMPLFAVRP